MALQTAGNSMVGGGAGADSMLGVRSMRSDYLKPQHRTEIARNLRLIEERDEQERSLEPVASEERMELPRFAHLFKGGELLPPAVFVAALELGSFETLNGRQMPFDADVMILRDNLVSAYKPLVHKIRQLNAKEIEELPQRLVLAFTRAWTAWEASWLRNREAHAVDALQPLAKAILSLEPLLHSVEKERLLPWPRVQHQKVVTLKCLEGFVHSLSELASCVLPSLRRELDHDPRLLLLMDHVLKLQGNKSVRTCLSGVSATPEVAFPDQPTNGGGGLGRAPVGMQAAAGAKDGGKGLTLDAYAFRLLGASVGDAVASGKLPADHAGWGTPRSARSLGGGKTPCAAADMAAKLAARRSARQGGGPGMEKLPVKESELARKAAVHGADLLGAFETVKDLLLSLKSSLEYIDPALDRDDSFVATLHRFERAFRKAKRQFLEPDNLA